MTFHGLQLHAKFSHLTRCWKLVESPQISSQYAEDQNNCDENDPQYMGKM